MAKRKATEEDVRAFLDALYDGNTELVLPMFDEKKALNEATAVISELLAKVKDAEKERGRRMLPTKGICSDCTQKGAADADR